MTSRLIGHPPDPAAIGESMTETTKRGVAAAMAATNDRGQPLKTAQYLAEGERLTALVNAHRAARDEPRSDASHAYPSAEVPLAQTGSPDPDCNKRKSYRLPPLATPTPIDGYPLNPPSPAQEMPDYKTLGRVKAMRAAQAARRSKRAPMNPSGPSELRKASQ